MGREGLLKAAFSTLLGVVFVVIGLMGAIYVASFGAWGFLVWLVPLIGLVFFVAAYLRLRYEFAEPAADEPSTD